MSDLQLYSQQASSTAGGDLLPNADVSSESAADNSQAQPWVSGSQLVSRTVLNSHRHDPLSTKGRPIRDDHTLALISQRRQRGLIIEPSCIEAGSRIQEVIEEDEPMEDLEERAHHEQQEIAAMDNNNDVASTTASEDDLYLGDPSQDRMELEQDDQTFQDQDYHAERDSASFQQQGEIFRMQDDDAELFQQERDFDLSSDTLDDTDNFSQLMQELNQTRQEVLSLERTRNDLLISKDNLTTRIQELEALSNNLEREVHTLEADLASERGSYARLRSEFAEQTLSLTTASDKIQEHKCELTRQQQELTALNNRIQQLTAEGEPRAKYVRAVQQQRLYKDRCVHLESQVELMKTHQATMHELSSQKQTKIESLQRTVHANEAALRNFHLENQRLKSELTTARSQAAHPTALPSSIPQSTANPTPQQPAAQSTRNFAPEGPSRQDARPQTSTQPPSTPQRPSNRTSGRPSTLSHTPATPSNATSAGSNRTPNTGMGQPHTSTPAPSTPSAATSSSQRPSVLLSNPQAHLSTPSRPCNPSTPQTATPATVRPTGTINFSNIEGTRLFEVPNEPSPPIIPANLQSPEALQQMVGMLAQMLQQGGYQFRPN